MTSLFKAMYSAPAGSVELRRNALQSVSRPAVFASLLQQFSARIPDEAALALRLETASGFNHDRAIQVAGAFRSSLEEFDLIDANGNLLPARDDEGASEESLVEDDAAITGEPRIPTGPGLFRLEVPLAEGRRALLALPEDIAAADTKKICAVLAAYTTD